MKENIKTYIKIGAVVILIIAVFVFVYNKDKGTLSGIKLPGYNLSNDEGTSLIPGIGQNNQLELMNTNPQDNNTISGAYIKFEFNKAIKAADFTISVTPTIGLKKEVKPANANILWVSTTKIWEENTKYTITLKNKNLKEDIVYTTTFYVPETAPITSGGPLLSK